MDKALVGILSITTIEGRNLKSMELIGKQDPYCKFELGSYSKRGKTVNKGGKNPYFGEEELLFWIAEGAWINNMVLSCYDEDVGSDDLIGTATFSVLRFMRDIGSKEHLVPLKNNNKDAGEVLLKFEFLPAGKLTIDCVNATGLREVDTVGQQDPYLKFVIEGACTKTTKRTKTATDGGTDPRWDESLSFEIVDQFNVTIECWDADTIGEDDLIGETTISLLPFYRFGYSADPIPIFYKGKWGGNDQAGELNLEFSFQAMKNIAFPQHQPGMDTYDHRERKTKHQIETMGTEPDAEAIRQADVVGKKGEDADGERPEFSEDEIKAAFSFIDLDKNNFIGSSEIRHILICMGELITDEEINEMVHMCDDDGDGQISYEEFRLMVIHPDPSRPDFKSEVQDTAPVATAVVSVEISEEERKRLNEIKQQKRAFLMRFVENSSINENDLRRAFAQYQKLEKPDGAGVDFDEFIDIFELEATGENKKLFSLYTGDGATDLDMKEFLLGACHSTNMDKPMRAKFCFTIFDDDHNGFITEEELVNILKANHMTTAELVQRKAQTIMKQADEDGDNKMNLEEFLVICKKFPNILFPPS